MTALTIEDFNLKNTSDIFKVTNDTLPLLRFNALENTGIVDHCFTSRLGGASQGIFDSLNLSFTRGDDPNLVMENYRRVATDLNSDIDHMVCSDQTHTTNVKRIFRKDAGCGLSKDRYYSDVDGLITNEPGIVLATFYADCVPLYFVDPVNKAIGLSHSGWRGTVNRMGRCTVKAMEREFGTKAADLICAIGPSICQSCYEVGEDVANNFIEEFKGYEDQILIEKPVTDNGISEKKYLLNLWAANQIILREAGVKEENIHTTNICTCCNDKLLFSHRASQGKRGNLGAFMGLKKAL